jgi:hypothetical protein
MALKAVELIPEFLGEVRVMAARLRDRLNQ